MFRFLVKIPKHKTFNYSPIYFNEEKEDLDKRLRQLEKEGKSNAVRIERGSLKESWGRSNRIAKSNKDSVIRLLVIIVLLLLIVFWIFK